MNLEVAVSV